MKKLLIILFIILLQTSVIAGGGWPQPKGKGYFKLSQFWILSNQYFNSIGTIEPNRNQGLFFTNAYGEYGLSDRFTAVVNWPFYARAVAYEQTGTMGQNVPQDAINGVGDMDLSVKYGLTKGKSIAVSASLILGLPLGESSGGVDGILQTGDGEFNQIIQLDAGRGFKVGPLHPYANVFVALNNRTNGFSDEFRYGIEVGLEYKFIFASLRVNGVRSFKNGSKIPIADGASLFANNAEYLAITPEIAIKLSDRWGVTANMGTAAWGKLIFANKTYSVGAYFKL
ncbi:MAG: hypothetical protein L3J06_02565 [Cyclobacteriaceae bacterium]|nr:hypothetical protein [Cyclobacteriaceae bacterium]